YHGDERDAGHVMAFAHHLRTHEHVDRAVVPALQDATLRAGALRDVAIEALDGDVRIGAAERRFDALGADPVRFERRSLAALAARRRPAGMVAVMACERAARAMPGERDAALRAVGGRPARRTLEVGRKPASIEEHERLLAAGGRLGERLAELVGE